MILNNFWKSDEGNNWFKRNENEIRKKTLMDENVIDVIKKYNMNKKNILEIGCSDGSRLNYMSEEFKDSNYFGIDVSDLAIESGKKLYKHIKFLNIGANDLNSLEDNFFDIIIFGHCLMVIDVNSFQKIVSEINRLLKKNGHIFIVDWYNKEGKRNIEWRHNKNYYCNKFDYSKFFTIFPEYILINRTFMNHESNVNSDKQYEFDYIDEVIVLDIIKKFI